MGAVHEHANNCNIFRGQAHFLDLSVQVHATI